MFLVQFSIIFRHMLIFKTLLALQNTQTYAGFKCVPKFKQVFISQCLEPPEVVASESESSLK